MPTTQISLIRNHTETINPPRALCVPFELGRPLGIPNDPAFQSRIIIAALKLLEASEGPVLENFEEDAPLSADDMGPIACPVDFSSQHVDLTDLDHLVLRFQEEVSQMRNWYDLAVERRSRTTAGSSGLSPDEVVAFLTGFLKGDSGSIPSQERPLGTTLKMAVEDLKAYYLEAVTGQPGQPSDSKTLSDWFWGQTVAAQIISKIRETCMASDSENLALVGKMLLIPKTELHRFEG